MAQYKDDKLLHKIAVKLKALRNAKGLSLETVYFDTDIHIGRIESEQSNITISTLSKICEYYETSLADFFTSLSA